MTMTPIDPSAVLTDTLRQLEEARRQNDELQSILVTQGQLQPCGHAQIWRAYADPLCDQSTSMCLWCEIERLTALARWKPVSATPPDGSKVLLWTNSGYCIGRYLAGQANCFGWTPEHDNGWYARRGAFWMQVAPLAWMPLPKGPGEAKP